MRFVPAADPTPSGDATIHGRFRDSDIVLKTTSRLAGAIDSITWRGHEFIDSHDHGRQLQSALGVDFGQRPFNPECFNPTEAGSRDDDVGPVSTSRLLDIQAAGDTLSTRTQMAFWLAPGERSSGQPALNEKRLSDFIVEKHVHIGHAALANVLEYTATFSFPPAARSPFVQVEAVTGYMPAEFDHFYRFESKSGTLEPISSVSGEIHNPVVLATADGQFAMGIISPDSPPASYGRFHFEAARVNKWNCVFRLRDPNGVGPGPHTYHMFIPLGTLADTRAAFVALNGEFPK
jgi:hypothetical protein